VADFGGQTQMVVKMVVRPIANPSEGPAATNDPVIELRCYDEGPPTNIGSGRCAAMLCLDAAFKAHLGLTISRRSQARARCLKRSHRAIDMEQPKVGAPHRSGLPRCGSQRLRRGLERLAALGWA
jgi:hypothetical protein